uniref:TIL domain-containing protein n=1 Tax=Anopheles christyi TaxID=43041 RepID=A0A182K815_9DIPT
MRFFLLCCVPLLAALISCSFAQDTEDAVGQSITSAETNEREQPEQRCVPTKLCGADEVFKCCGPCYQLTCNGTVLNCAGRCYAECYCASGFVREYPGGRCIPKMFCEKPPLPILSDYDDSLCNMILLYFNFKLYLPEPCQGQYEQYRCCGNCSQETCYEKEQMCKTKCTKGCYCLKGFVRQYQGGKCIPKKLCYYYWSRGFDSG